MPSPVLDAFAFASNSGYMYRIIGSDGKEYGPVSAQQLREWISQGRVGTHTKVLAEGSNEWRPLSDFPEFMVGAAPAAPGTPMVDPTLYITAANTVSAPAIALVVTAVLGFLWQTGSLATRFLGFGMSMANSGPHQMQMPAWAALFSGTLGIVTGVVATALSILVFIGGLKMRKLENYGLAMTASIIAAVPCVSPCCLIGLPVGIWAIVVLNRPEVKEAFDQNLTPR